MLANYKFARTVLLICQLFSYHQKAAEIALKRPENRGRSLGRVKPGFTLLNPPIYPRETRRLPGAKSQRVLTGFCM